MQRDDIGRFSDDAVSTAFRRIEAVLDWPLPQWESLVRYARRANLLARLAALLERDGLLERVPPAPRAHLESALVHANAQAAALRAEIRHVEAALARLACPVLLLKGSAYLALGHPTSQGRVFSDVDLLVPRDHLAEAESALMLAGWASTHHDAYDQRYYRKWMHELPPLRHVKRLSVVDVHHAILPVTARLRPDSAKLIACSVAVPGSPFRVLAPPDMILHSAAHLFHNEEVDQGLRDLSDLDALLRSFTGEVERWPVLLDRARELDLERPLAYALRYAHHFFATPIPEAILRKHAPPHSLMDALYLRAMRPDRLARDDRAAALARKCLYVRAHWLRMPPWLLVYHLGVKSLKPQEPATA